MRGPLAQTSTPSRPSPENASGASAGGAVPGFSPPFWPGFSVHAEATRPKAFKGWPSEWNQAPSRPTAAARAKRALRILRALPVQASQAGTPAASRSAAQVSGIQPRQVSPRTSRCSKRTSTRRKGAPDRSTPAIRFSIMSPGLGPARGYSPARSEGISRPLPESLRPDRTWPSATGAHNEEASVDDRLAVDLRLRQRLPRCAARRRAERDMARCRPQGFARERGPHGVLAGRVWLSREVLGHGAGRRAGPVGRDRARTLRALRGTPAGRVRRGHQGRADRGHLRG